MKVKSFAIPSLVILLNLSILTVNAEENVTRDTWHGLHEMMSSEEFKATGLDKLSTEELQQLDAWLIRFLAYDSKQVIQSDEKIQNLQKTPVRRRIAGHFSGWSGATIFVLDNGEVWKQRTTGSYAIAMENPEVEIVRNLFGFYELKIVKTGSKIGVTRVK